MVDGATLREHLEVAQRLNRKADPALIPPDVDPAFLYLLDWFAELDAARSGTGFGMNLLSYSEMLAWATLTRRTIAAWEVDAIKRIDRERVSYASKKAGANNG